MSYPKKNQQQPKSQNHNAKLSDKQRERLLNIQQREHLKGLIVNKFLEKYGKKGGNAEIINQYVGEFMKTQKLNEKTLRNLEEKIKNQTLQQVKQGKNSKDSIPGSKAQKLENHCHQDGPKVQIGHQDDKTSNYSDDSESRCPKSVYQLGDEDDEWATIMKFDNELFKKEKELEKNREVEQKRKIKAELDRQLMDKQSIKQFELQELKDYNLMQDKQLELYDEREREKENQKKQKIMAEKKSRDKQLLEEYQRKKQEKKREKDLDDLLVHRIKEELDMEQRLMNQKRLDEKNHLKKVLLENEENRRRQELELRKEREHDIRAQEEYTRLIEKQEAERVAEMQKREERAKAFMAMMSDTVIKDQKAQIWEEEQKILQHYKQRDQKEKEEEEERKMKQKKQKEEMREFLDKQVNEKNQRKRLEQELSQKQAQFWKQDTNDFFDNEKRKEDYVKSVNKRHQDILKQQMKDNAMRKVKGKNKMTVQELLQNKQVLKEIAHSAPQEEFQKAMVQGEGLKMVEK